MPFPDETNLTTLATLKAQQLDPPPIGSITAINVAASGSSYTGTPAVAINDPTGTGATATAVVVGNVVTSINVTAKGQGYTNPSVVISGGGGSGATATAKLGSDDALLGLINRASAVICEAVNRPKIFDSGVNVTERRNGNGQDRMTVAVDPIISVSSLTIDGATVPASDGQSAGYLFDSTTIYLIGYVFTRWVQNVVLIYRGGCVANSGRQLQLEAACLATVALWWKRRAHIDQISQAMSNNAGTLTFTTKDLPAEAWTIINQIKRVAPLA
jgi:hypothetical protein